MDRNYKVPNPHLKIGKRGTARTIRLFAVGMAIALATSGCAVFESAVAVATGDFDTDQFAAEMQINAMLPVALYGYGGDPQHGYDEGVGTLWEQHDAQTGETFRTERALLRNNADGTQWWYVAIGDGDEKSQFEMRVDEDFAAREVLWRNPDTGEIQRITYEEPVRPDDLDGAGDDYEDVERTSEIATIANDPPEGYRVTREQQRISVSAGTFDTERVRLVAEDTPEDVYETWLSDEVPGRLVQQRWTEGNDEWGGELVHIRSDYSSTLGAF